MRIIIENKPEYNDAFIRWLVKQIKSELFADVNIELLNALNKKFELSNIEIDIERSYFQIVNSITFSKNRMNYHIFISPTEMIMGTSFKCVEIAKLINYGTIEILGYGVFSKIFQNVTYNLNSYLLKYNAGLGVI